MYAFLGFEGDSVDLALPSSNLWVLPSEDIAGHAESYYRDPFSAEQTDKPMLLFIGFPSAKDPSLRVKYPNKSTCVVITEAKAEWFEQFQGTETNKRPAEYEALKKRFEARLVEGVLAHFPQLEGRLRYCEVASPLTNSFYLGRAASYGLTHQVRTGGAGCMGHHGVHWFGIVWVMMNTVLIYGVADVLFSLSCVPHMYRYMKPSRYTSAGGLRPQTDIPGLWLTGQVRTVRVGHITSQNMRVLHTHTPYSLTVPLTHLPLLAAHCHCNWLWF